uniref:Nitrogen permease regulator 3 n=1 Tax=Parastrongyloides trichosuri TaxID=131310 RepID=A0A0N4ZB05_PARTI
MKGVLLVDDRDSVIFTNGDNEFLTLIKNFDNIREDNESETTIISDDLSLSGVNNNATQFITIDIPNRQATDVFLPLIMLFNSQRAQQNIIINEIESYNLKFFFRHLSEQHYIIYVTEVNYKVDSEIILKKLHHLFRFYLGPFEMLMRNELSSVRHAKNMLKFRVLEIIEGKKPFHQCHLDHPSYPEKAYLFCKNLSNSLKAHIPNNLCLLIRKGTLLASAGTDSFLFGSNHLTDFLSNEDIEELMHIRDIRLRFNVDEEFDSVWLKLKKRKGILSFVNVFFIKVTNEISTLMVIPFKDAWRIYQINEMFEYLYELNQMKSVKRCLLSINKIIYDLFPKNKIDYTEIDHILYKNHGRRIINIWSKLEKHLLTETSKKDGEDNKKNNQAFSLYDNSYNDNFKGYETETKSMTTSLFSILNKPKQALKFYFDNSKIHLDFLEEVMIAQLKRMFRFYLNDILEHNKNESRINLLAKARTEFKYCYAGARMSLFKKTYEDIHISLDENILGYVVTCSLLPFRYYNIPSKSEKNIYIKSKIDGFLTEYMNSINFVDVEDKEEVIEISGFENDTIYFVKYTVNGNYLNNAYIIKNTYPSLFKVFTFNHNQMDVVNSFQIYALFADTTNKENAIQQLKNIIKSYYHHIINISKYILT